MQNRVRSPQGYDVRELELDTLRIGAAQARLRDVEAELDELTESIRIHGLLEPIIVTPATDPGTYEIVSGQRRYLAHKVLCRDTILAVVIPSVDEATAKVLSLTENVVRRDLDPKDLVDICTSLFRKYGTSLAVAEETGIPYSKVRKYVKYERLCGSLRHMVEAGQLSLDVALTAHDLLSADPGDVEEEIVVDIATKLGRLPPTDQRQARRQLQRNATTSPAKIVEHLDELLDRHSQRDRPSDRGTRLVILLSREEMDHLIDFSHEKGMTVDQAARKMIAHVLSIEARRTVSSKNGSTPASKNGSVAAKAGMRP